MDVTMPQLGETVTEGTITRWFKQVGEHIEADEPLFEVSTDKVDSEVPAPTGGCRVRDPRARGRDRRGRRPPRRDLRPAAGAGAAPAPAAPEAPRAGDARGPNRAGAPRAGRRRVTAETPAAPAARSVPVNPTAASSAEADGRHRAALAARAPQPAAANGGRRRVADRAPARSPSTASIPRTIRGTGEGGRITRNDVLAAARDGRPARRAPHRRPTAPRAPRQPRPRPRRRPHRARVAPRSRATRSSRSTTSAAAPPSTWCGRRRRARTSTRRCASTSNASNAPGATHQAEWKATEGFSLTYLPFIVRAFSDVVHDYPHVNASVDGDTLVVHRDIHLGIAIDLDFKGSSRRSSGTPTASGCGSIAREIRDLAARAKSKQLGSRRARRRHVHDHEHGSVRHDADVADHQPAAGRDPRHRRHPQGAGRDRRARRRGLDRGAPRRPPRARRGTTVRSTARTPRRSSTRCAPCSRTRDWEAELA